MRRNAKQNRQEALDSGSPHYFGRACTYCHSTQRDTETARCSSCGGRPNDRPDAERQRKYSAEYYHRTKDARKEQRLLIEARKRAKQQGLIFELTIEDIVIPDICPVLKKPMISPSLDRKDNTKGYVKGNVFVISLEANQKKRNSSIEDLEAILAYMRSD